MENVDDLVMDAVLADSRFDGLGFSESEIEFIKVYESATGQRFFVTKKNMSALHKGVACFEAYGVIGDTVEFIKLANEVGNAIQEEHNGKACKAIQDFVFGNVLSGIVVNQIAIVMTAAAINPFVAFATLVVLSYGISECGVFFSDVLADIFNLYDDAGAYTYPVDPLIFDLNGDGVKTVALADGVHFDFDKNGFAEKIGWVSAEDGLLVRDLDKNGKIDSGRELMGDLTELSDDLLAANGFEALSYFDANADGVIDAKDDIYNELQIWQDKNQNGVVDGGELMSLSEAGIASINLAYENIDVRDESGNGHSQRGTYTKTDGTTSTVEDVWFEKDAANTVVSDTIDKNVLEETDEIAGLPDIQGKGNQYSLHQAGVYLKEAADYLEMLVA